MRVRGPYLTIVLLALVVFATGCCTPLATETRTVTLHPQETSMWCWAASGQMVMHYLGNNVSQCDQANHRFGVTNCPCNQCTSPVTSPPCVFGGWPDFDHYGFSSTRTSDTALTWDQVRKEISAQSSCGNRPFAFTWHWPGGGGHVMVANGFSTADGTRMVYGLDPWAPCNGDTMVMTYDYYVASAGHHTHWDDFYAVRPK